MSCEVKVPVRLYYAGDIAAAIFSDQQPHQPVSDETEVVSFLMGKEVSPFDIPTLSPHLRQADRGQFEPSYVQLSRLERDIMQTWLSWQPGANEEGLVPLSPITDQEILGAIELEKANDEVQAALIGTFLDYHLQAEAGSGEILQAPSTYQIAEPGFRAFNQGKATADELRVELDRIIQTANEQSVDLGLVNQTALRKLMIQMGLGIDCSNFVYRYLSKAHERLGLPSYDSFVYRPSDEVLQLNESGRWPVRGTEEGSTCNLANNERSILTGNKVVPVSWIRDVFGKDSARITGAAHICSKEAAKPLQLEELMPGDLISFRRPSTGRVSHVAAIFGIEKNERGTSLEVMHSTHTRGFDSGLRLDTLRINSSGQPIDSTQKSLIDPERYRFSFCRPQAIATHYDSLRAARRSK